MKKTLLALVVLTGAAFSSFAQTSKPVSFGIKGGLNLSKLTASGGGESMSTGTLTSFHAGLFADVAVSETFSVQPALLFTQLGSKETEGDASAKTTINYLQLPVNAIYSAPTGTGKFFIGAGPFLGYGLSAKYKISGAGEANGSADIDFGDNGLKRVNVGVGALAGYKLEDGFLLNVGYDLGLTNIADTDGGSLKTRAFTVSVGYAF
ncbi:PorT family protein [Mucilaginibacter sp. UR6-1]|uniref:porin family protein n=1 Tax=Mucilaginibacter sp. UR6-1 TaxID=1435643 RepID=UPI001E31919E|nr:porin family protein [Mucilaginibacter sp. UR6-1]MCC8408672.1 PorT family protein [Mucilaginibacter sp. UR6-1]